MSDLNIDLLLTDDVVSRFARAAISPGEWWNYPEAPNFERMADGAFKASRRHLAAPAEILRDMDES